MDKYSKLNIRELKSLLIKRNAKTTGKKADLVERYVKFGIALIGVTLTLPMSHHGHTCTAI